MSEKFKGGLARESKVSYAEALINFYDAYKTLGRKYPIIQNETIEDEEIKIDFKEYRKCTFKNCEIILEWGIFRLSDCVFDHCNFILIEGSPAQMSIKIALMADESYLKGMR